MTVYQFQNYTEYAVFLFFKLCGSSGFYWQLTNRKVEKKEEKDAEKAEPTTTGLSKHIVSGKTWLKSFIHRDANFIHTF